MFSITAMWLSQEILVHDNRCRGNTIYLNLISKTVFIQFNCFTIPPKSVWSGIKYMR